MNAANPPYGNRTYTVVSGTQTPPTVYFNNDSLNVPLDDFTVTFQVNMGTYISRGLFDRATDKVYARGTWNNSELVDVLSAAKETDSVFVKAIVLQAPHGTTHGWQYWIDRPGAANGGWEGRVGPDPTNGNRVYTPTGNAVLPVVYFANAGYSVRPVTETEPNNTASQANYMEYGDSLDAAISPVGDVDYYRFVAASGDTVEVFGHDRNSSGLYGMIGLYDGTGNSLAGNTSYYDPPRQRVVYIVPTGGTYYVRYAYQGNGGNFPNATQKSKQPAVGKALSLSHADALSVSGQGPWSRGQGTAGTGVNGTQRPTTAQAPGRPSAVQDYDNGDYRILLRKFVPSAPTIDWAGWGSLYFDRVTLTGSLYPNGLSTTVTFEYGTSSSYGSSVPAMENPVNGIDNYSVSSPWVTGLSPSTLYYARTVAVNSVGSTEYDWTFMTPAAPEGWTVQNSGTTAQLYGVCSTDANTGTAVGGEGTILRTTDGGSHWVPQTSNTGDWLYSVIFVDANNGWVVGASGTIRRTTDGGNIWASQTTGVSNSGDVRLYGVSCTDAMTATAVGQQWFSGTGWVGAIFRTTDGGSHWASQTSGVSNTLRAVAFTDANTGIAVGHNGVILRTTNGGSTWVNQTSPTTYSLRGVCFTDANTGTAVGDGGTTLHTTDGGATWTTQTNSGIFNQFGVTFTDAMNGALVGENGKILRTADGGQHWTVQQTGTSVWLYGVSFAGPNVGYAVGDYGTILKTTGYTHTANMPVTAGWNMVSVPLVVADMNLSSLFPTALTKAFSYLGTYNPDSVLNVGTGYWLKFGSAGSVPVSGASFVAGTIPVLAGWNLIGAFDQPTNTGSVISTPSGILTTPFYGFNGKYTPALTLQPGSAYWVKASQVGTIRLASTPFKPSAAFAGFKETWIRIEFQDSSQSQVVLGLAAPEELKDLCQELPPLPPDGVFDVRYASNAGVESLAGGRYALQLASVCYPLSVTARNTQGHRLRLRDELGSLRTMLEEGKAITLLKPPGRLLLEEGKNAVDAPATFELSQNYPNPFNPTTVIKFGLPRDSKVQLSVYNILGQKVADLLNETREAGYHSVEFNATRLASGSYFYRIETGSYTAVKKMLILR